MKTATITYTDGRTQPCPPGVQCALKIANEHADQRITMRCRQRTQFGMSARWQLAMWRPIGQFCANGGWLHRVPVAVPNGGSACVLPGLLYHSAWCRPST
jgi:hypothetical protein